MKVKIGRAIQVLRDQHRTVWWFIVTLAGKNIASRNYSTRRACIRGLWRWWDRACAEITDRNGRDLTLDAIEQAIRESRVKK